MIDDERAHHDGLASAGRHLEAKARKAAGEGLRNFKIAEYAWSHIHVTGGDLIQKNRDFNRLLLREEDRLREIALLVLEPKMQQFASDARCVLIIALAPGPHFAPEHIDEMLAMTLRPATRSH
ncbi:MAG: hypothetical protein ABIP20_08990 [Chthoniobacteraceae bacterium]